MKTLICSALFALACAASATYVVGDCEVLSTSTNSTRGYVTHVDQTGIYGAFGSIDYGQPGTITESEWATPHFRWKVTAGSSGTTAPPRARVVFRMQSEGGAFGRMEGYSDGEGHLTGEVTTWGIDNFGECEGPPYSTFAVGDGTLRDYTDSVGYTTTFTKVDGVWTAYVEQTFISSMWLTNALISGVTFANVNGGYETWVTPKSVGGDTSEGGG